MSAIDHSEATRLHASRGRAVSAKAGPGGSLGASVLRSSPGKLYLHVASLMRRRLETDVWEPGAQLPTLAELAEEFGVSNVTIRQAVAILEDEGLVRRRQGRGTFASEQAAPRPTFAVGLDWPSPLEMVTKSTPSRLASSVAANPPPARPEDGTLAPAYRYLRRVNTVDSRPCLVMDAYLDLRIYERAPARFESETLVTALQSLPDVHIARCRQVLTIGHADLETARLLGVPVTAPMGEVCRIITDPDGVIIYYHQISYRGDLVRFEIDVYPDRDANRMD